MREVYDAELGRVFPRCMNQIEGFLRKYSGEMATVKTPADKVSEYVRALRKLATVAATDLEFAISQGHDITSLALLATRPARRARTFDSKGSQQVGRMMETERIYYVLDRAGRGGDYDFLLLLQRLPGGVDTHPEVHKTGIEVYLPLTGGIEFFVNKGHFRPVAVKTTIAILPGDIHHHINEGSDPAWALIVAGFGFGRGEKTQEQHGVDRFVTVKRFEPLAPPSFSDRYAEG